MSHCPYPITSPWGPRKSGFHYGVDIGFKVGTKLFAARKAKAYNRNEGNSGFGRYVKLVAGDVVIYYSHLSKSLVKDGQTVKPGDLIALSGNSGNSTGPHLHFEVRVKGKPVKPNSYFGSLFHPGPVVHIGPSLIEWAFKVIYNKTEASGAFYDKVRAGVKGLVVAFVDEYGYSPVESANFFKKFAEKRGAP